MHRTQRCAWRACANVSLRYPPFDHSEIYSPREARFAKKGWESAKVNSWLENGSNALKASVRAPRLSKDDAWTPFCVILWGWLKGAQFGNPETIRENQAIGANLRINSHESGPSKVSTTVVLEAILDYLINGVHAAVVLELCLYQTFASLIHASHWLYLTQIRMHLSTHTFITLRWLFWGYIFLDDDKRATTNVPNGLVFFFQFSYIILRKGLILRERPGQKVWKKCGTVWKSVKKCRNDFVLY